MTATQMIPAIGAQVEVATDFSVTVSCRVRDVKVAWGNIRLLVEPVAGSGQSWIDLSRLRQSSGRNLRNLQVAQ
jgi:hypothetical protein